MEKYEISSINLSDEAEEDNSDEAYENMMTRENYIVDLISRYSGQETSREEWENNLQYLKLHYDEIIALENINRIYVDLYIEDYEIVEATKKIVSDVKEGKIKIDDINKDMYNSYLFNDLPPIDLMIRTSGEYRISNFMLWQMAYAELYFTDVLWPDFDEKELHKAIDSFNKRDRRFGGVKK